MVLPPTSQRPVAISSMSSQTLLLFKKSLCRDLSMNVCWNVVVNLDFEGIPAESFDDCRYFTLAFQTTVHIKLAGMISRTTLLTKTKTHPENYFGKA